MVKKKNLLKQFADEHRMIAYHPEWRSFTGSVTATILLQQINYLWDQHGNKPFYKFRAPCDHKYYRAGDSWTEELGFGLKEFDNAIKRIGQKVSAIKRKKNETINQHTRPVEYWVDDYHTTWYQIHEKNFMAMLSTIYETPEKQGETPDCESCSYLTKRHLGKRQNGDQGNDETAIRETTKRHLDLNDETAFRKPPKSKSDLVDQRDPAEKRDPTATTTETRAPAISATLETDPAAVAVVDQINLLISQSRKGEYISIVTLHQIVAAHQVNTHEILQAAQALAGIPAIKSIAGMLLGGSNGNGHVSHCFAAGKCVLTPHAPETPPPNTRNVVVLQELTEEQLRERYAQLDAATREEIIREPMERMRPYKNSMSKKVWNETIASGIPALMRDYLVRNGLLEVEDTAE